MAQEVAEREEVRTAVPAAQSETLLAQIIAASTNPEVDAAKMEQMANLATRLQDRERETQFAQDFAAAVMEMPRISKQNRIIMPVKGATDGRTREQGKFASWENIDKVIRPILAKNRLVLTFRLGHAEGGAVAVTPILTHRNGYREVGDAMRVPADQSGAKNAAQMIGSSSSYGKRYAGCAMLNIVTEDEDRDGTMYMLATDELNDRQQRRIDEAHAAHKDGNYAAFWEGLAAQDRELLVVRGVHAQLTGAPSLPGPRTVDPETAAAARPEPEPEVVDDQGGAEDQGAPTGTKEARSPEQMVEDYKARVNACKDTEELMTLQRDPKIVRWLGRLKDSDLTLYEKATTASSTRYAELLASEGAGQPKLV